MPPPAVLAALRLAAAEPLIAALEAWQGEALDPEPLDGGASWPGLTESLELIARVVDGGLAPPGTALRVPWAWLQDAPFPVRLAAALDWEDLPCTVVLGHVPPPCRSSALAKGDLLLLAASFQAEWFASVRPIAGLVGSDVRLPIDPGRASLLTDAPHGLAAARPVEAGAWSVEVLAPLRLPLASLRPGWGLPSGSGRGPDLPPLDLGLFDAEGVLLALGHLLALGQGWGLHLHEVLTSATDPAPTPMTMP